MPATAFDPFYAIGVHSTVDFDPTVLASLQAEDFLLIHRCEPEVKQGKEEFFRPVGKNILTVYSPGQLSWNIEASVLRWEGLADYHPGAALSRRLLPCANATYRRPFQFATGGVLVYESPRLGQPAGGLPSLAFTIAEVLGNGLDEVTWPDISTGGTGPTSYATIADQAAVEMHADGRNGLLREIWNGDTVFDDAPLFATVYVGDPAISGIALTAALELAPWATFDEPVLDYSTRARNDAAIDWPDTEAYERVATHIRITRNAVIIGDIELDPPLTIPAGQGIRAPIDSLAIKLTWPLDTGDAETPTAASYFMPYVMGGNVATYLPSNDMDVTVGIDVDTDTATEELVPGTAAYWTVTGVTVTPAGITGTDLAGGGGWSLGAVTVRLNDNNLILLREITTLTVAAGAPFVLDGSPVLDLDASPD